MEEEKHGWECNCWLCEGRKPDAQNDYHNKGYGSCAYCGQALSREDSTVHEECSAPFRAFLMGVII